ncbi:MAG TPA: peptide-methionine (R)-S-oxide reductase, partial [Alphaproteobacteria bacterium]
MTEGTEKKMSLSDAEWRQRLTPEQYQVARQKGTERAFSGAYWQTKTPGTYRCACCGEALFGSGDKYDSGTGWPSFTRPLDAARVA